MTASLLCALCEENVERGSVIEGQLSFCCRGCQAVYHVIVSKGDLPNASHPIYLGAKRAGMVLGSEKRDRQPSIGNSYRFDVRGMWCPSCAELIERLLVGKEGIEAVFCDYTTDILNVTLDPKKIGKSEIRSLLSPFGYLLSEFGDDASCYFPYLTHLMVAAFIALQAMMFSYPLYAFQMEGPALGWERIFSWILMALSLPLVGYSAFPLFRKAFFSLVTGSFGMELLVSLGVGSAFLASLFSFLQGGTEVYIDSLSFIVVFVLLGKFIESKAKFSSKKILHALSRSLPKRIRTPSGYRQIQELVIGDLFIVEAGERIPLDGVVEEGDGECDESILTGEPLELPKSKQDGVLAGSHLIEGRLVIRATTTSDTSTLSSIMDFIHGGLLNKQKNEKSLSDKLASVLVPIIILIATLSAAVHFFLYGGAAALSVFLSVLLISCPCALGIAVPIVEAQLLEASTKKGVLVRNRKAFDILGNESVFIFDKTGTLTEGRPQIVAEEGAEKGDCRTSLASLAALSQHPLSRAVKKAFLEAGSLKKVDRFLEIPGMGIKGVVQGVAWHMGSYPFMQQSGFSFPKHGDEFSETTLFFASQQGDRGMLRLHDKTQKFAGALVQGLSRVQTVLLSGDSQKVVKELGKTLGCSESHGRMTPLEKKNYIVQAKAKGKRVVMLGDGINDAPAIAEADIGISVASAQEISMHVSDIVMMTSDLEVLLDMRKLFKKGRRIMKQNLFWAFFYNTLAIPIAATGGLVPLFAAAAMVMSSLVLLYNTSRLK